MGIFRSVRRLLKTRDDLEARLLLREARHCFGDYECDDGTDFELRSRINEVGSEIRALGRISG